MRERQVSFAGGELAPSLWGRTDLDRYPVGARTLLNFIVTPHGILVNRPGTQHLTTHGIATDVRLASFETAYGSFVLLFANDLLRVYSLSGTTMTLVTSFATNYVTSDLVDLRFAQVGNVMTIVVRGKVPSELRATSASSFTYSQLTFEMPEFPTWTGTAKLERRYKELLGVAVENDARDFDGNSSHPAREWQWAVTRIMRDSNGRLYETLKQVVALKYDAFGTDSAVPESVAVYPDWVQTIVWGQFSRSSLVGLTDGDGTAYQALSNSSAPAADDDVLFKTRVYRGRDGHYGYIGETSESYFVDDGTEPDFSNPPPEGVNPFEVFAADGSLTRTEDPALVCFFENRRYFAGTDERPATVFGSALDDYANFDEVLPADDADALQFALASKKFERIRAAIPLERLILLTNKQAWVAAGSGEANILTPNSIAARPMSGHGCASTPEPVVAGSTIFYPQTAGGILRALTLGSDVRDENVSLMSQHLLDGHSIKDMAYAEDPYSILWVLRDDGVLMSLTFMPEQHVVAWAPHDFGTDGVINSICVIEGDGEEVLLMEVERDSGNTIERLASRDFDDIRDAIFLDRSVSYDGRSDPNDIPPLPVDLRDTYATGATVGTIIQLLGASGLNYFEVGTVLEIADITDSDADPIRVVITVINNLLGSDHQAQVLNRDVPTDMLHVQTYDYSICTASVTGLSHLEGETVTAVVDGNVVTDIVVTAGAAVIAAEGDYEGYAAVAHVGVGYNSDLESLDAINEKGREKIVAKVTLELEYTRGGKVGSALEGRLTELRTREVSDAYAPMVGKRVEADVIIQDSWNRGGRVALRQDQPLPMTVLGITRDIKYGGD